MELTENYGKKYAFNWNIGKVPSGRICEWPNKVCRECKEEKPRSEFHNKEKAKDLKSIYCVGCSKKMYEERKEGYIKRQVEKRISKKWQQGDVSSIYICEWPNKTCIKCNLNLPISAFGKFSSRKDGHNSVCKSCVNATAKKYRKPSLHVPNLRKKVVCGCYKKQRAKIRGDRKIWEEFKAKGCEWGMLCEWPLKVCSKCKEPKERESFVKDTSRKDNLGNKCRDCRGVIHKRKKRKEDYVEYRKRENNKKKKRRLAEKIATPCWLTKEHKKQIAHVYDHMRDCCRTTGEKYEVNHVQPLRGENICGLHVPWNLEVLPRYINSALGNAFKDDW